MNQLYKGKAKYILTWALALLFAGITLYGATNSFNTHYFHSNLTTNTIFKNSKIITQILVDTPPVKKPDTNFIKKQIPDSLKISDSAFAVIDTINFKTSKDSLDAPVTYHADDSMILDVPTNKIILYGKETKVKYLDNQLVAPHIEFDQKTNLEVLIL